VKRRPPDADVLIVGAGVIGCALARELAGRGRRVLVLERSEPGAEASSAAAGILSPQSDCRSSGPFFDLALESRTAYADWVSRLERDTGLSVGFRRTGLLRCARGEAESADLDAFLWQRDRGLPLEVWDSRMLARRFGNRISPGVERALYFPDEAVVDSRRLVEALATSARSRDVEIRPRTPVTGFLVEEGVCRGVSTASGPIEAENVVDAAGAWAAFDGALPLPVPVEPVRGQMVELEMGEAAPDTVLLTDAVYLVPRGGGRVLVGATLEHAGFRKEVTAGAVERLLADAADLFPPVRNATFVRAWAGLRPGTPDALPLLGGCGIAGLFFATGHFRSGILLAPVTALRIADVLTGRAPTDLGAFSVERFSGAAGDRPGSAFSAGVFS